MIIPPKRIPPSNSRQAALQKKREEEEAAFQKEMEKIRDQKEQQAQRRKQREEQQLAARLLRAQNIVKQYHPNKDFDNLTKAEGNQILQDQFRIPATNCGPMTAEEEEGHEKWKEGLPDEKSKEAAEFNERLSTEIIGLKFNKQKGTWSGKYTDLTKKNGTLLEHNIPESVVQDIFNLEYLDMIRVMPSQFYGIPIGDARDTDTLEKEIAYLKNNKLRVKIKLRFMQKEKSYCLTFGLASCLFYLGLKDESKAIAALAHECSISPQFWACTSICRTMREVVGPVGGFVLYNKRSKNGRIREMSVEDLCNRREPYPTY